MREFVSGAALAVAGFLLTGNGVSGEETRVSAYYYPWYGSEGRHWEDGYDGKKEGRGPALGEYDSRDAGVVRGHLAVSREFGIGNWICSWWGPGSWEDITLRQTLLPELETSAARDKPVTFSLFYEAGGLLGLDPEKGIEFDAAKVQLFTSHFRYLADHYFSHPACQRVGERPVVYLYLSRAFSGEYARALGAARAVVKARGFDLYLVGDEVYWHEPDPERLRLLDAVTPYNMHGPLEYAGLTDWTPFVEACDGVYTRWREAANAVGVRFIPGVMPGFNSGGVAPGVHYSIPRQLRGHAGPLSTLEAMSTMALKHLDPEFPEAAVTSFNEWHEGTQIEPSLHPDGAGEVLRRVFGGLPSMEGTSVDWVGISFGKGASPWRVFRPRERLPEAEEVDFRLFRG